MRFKIFSYTAFFLKSALILIGNPFDLAIGKYKFRADHQGSQYWATETLTPHQVNDIALSTGGGTFVLTVEKTPGDPIVDIPVYAFSQAGSYLGINARTDGSGQVSFDLADGGYRFRADYLGYQHWTSINTVPGMLSDVLTIAHGDVTVTVNEVYGADSDPISGVRVYLFTASGAYQGKYADTDANGQVVFSVPEQDYKVRADYLGAQHWSDLFSGLDSEVNVDIAHGNVNIHVTENGTDVMDAPVYLFTESGSYLSRMERTENAGVVQFMIPEGAYKFRVDHGGSQYWSDVVNVLPGEEANLAMALDLLALDLTRDPNPVRFDGTPPVKEEKPIYLASIFDISGVLMQSAVGGAGDEAVYYFINDHLGTPQKVVDESGVVVWTGDYKPFGQVNETVNVFGNRFRFAGQYHDGESGLHFNYYRYYGSKTGRYLRPDPIRLYGGINLFSYANNNPLIYFDSLGLACELINTITVTNEDIKRDVLREGAWVFSHYNTFVATPACFCKFFRYNYIRTTKTTTTTTTKEWKCIEMEGCPPKEKTHWEYETDHDIQKSSTKVWEKEWNKGTDPFSTGTLTVGRSGEGEDCTCRPFRNPNKYWW